MIMPVNKRRYPGIALESLGSRLRMIYENDEETAFSVITTSTSVE